MNKKEFKPIPKDIGDYIAYSEESSTRLVWKVATAKRVKKGEEVGNINSTGYFRFNFNYRAYFVHRIVYFLCTGIDPEENQVDHIDGDTLNNKISNLRLATVKQNADNSKKRKDNVSGVTGVHWCKSAEKYRAQINRFELGFFCDKDEAVAVRIAAETDPRFKDQEYRNSHNDQYKLTPEMLEWGKKYLEDRIKKLNWDI